MSISPKWVLGVAVAAGILLSLFIGIIIGRFALGELEGKNPKPIVEKEHSVEEIRNLLFGEVKADNIRALLRILTNESHPAGSKANEEVGQFIHDRFLEYGLSSSKFANYDVLLSKANETDPNIIRVLNADDSLHFQLKNKENVSNSDKYFGTSFFGYSAQGIAESDRIFYANQATEDDFFEISKMGISLNGSVILARYGGGFRGDKIVRAEKLGAKAVLLFLDPSLVAPDGIGESEVLPKGQWMPGSAMERGSLYTGDGDALSQGFVSEPLERMSYRQSASEDIPQIPAAPIGYEDAQALFNLMPNSVDLPKNWRPSQDMNYTFGGLLADGRKVVVKVTNYQEVKRIRNVIGTITGREEPDRYVLLGNHYDAWTFGGIDPNSGTAVMMEIARIMGSLVKKGMWRPKRTIVFGASIGDLSTEVAANVLFDFTVSGAWDAEEFGLIGSHEWVEENLQILNARAVAYINCDAAVRGRQSFVVAAMPLLADVIFKASKMVTDPFPVPSGSTPLSVYDVWGKVSLSGVPQIGKVSASSDYASFVALVGIPSADIRYAGRLPNPAYHTAFETFEYVDEFIDPGFIYHAVMTKVWAEIIRDLADSPLIPFSVKTLAAEMENSWQIVASDIAKEQYNFSAEINLGHISDAIAEFNASTERFQDNIDRVKSRADPTTLEIRQLNDILVGIERMFIDPNGLPGRSLTRHILQAPPRTNSYASTSFPGIVDCVIYFKEALKNNDIVSQEFWLKELKEHSIKVAQMIYRAARFLDNPALIL